MGKLCFCDIDFDRLNMSHLFYILIIALKYLMLSLLLSMHWSATSKQEKWKEHVMRKSAVFLAWVKHLLLDR